MNFQLIYTRRPNYEDWFRCRLVCHMWKEIMGPYPLITCSQSSNRRIPEEKDLTRVKGIFLNKCKSYSKELEYLRQYPQLSSQITLLFIGEYPTTYREPAEKQFYKLLEFNNLRCLSIGWMPSQNDEYFWQTLSERCPRLVWLHIHGNIRWCGSLNFPHLEFLGLRLLHVHHSEPSYNLPKLAHFSFIGMLVPQQLVHKYGPSLQSLLIHYIKPLSEITPEFWKHYASLRTFGFYPTTYRPVAGPPPEHPLRHLCIFLSHSSYQRVELVQAAIVNFPHILKLSIELPDPTKEEKNALLKMAQQSNFELQFLRVGE
jgi:hypothetical protein